MAEVTNLEEKIRSFRSSSIFTPGDPYCFSIDFGNGLSLPGKFNPTSYLTLLGTNVAGKSVLVICPGNGGLCVAAISMGAASVVAFEPRLVYNQPLSVVSKLTLDATGSTFGCCSLEDSRIVGSFDVVIWAEGVDEIVDSRNVFEKLLRVSTPDGRIYVELSHGHHTKLGESTNSWRPTKEAFEQTISEIGKLEILDRRMGRNQVRSVYILRNTTKHIKQTPRIFADQLEIVVSGQVRDVEIVQETEVDLPTPAPPEPPKTTVEKVAAKIIEIMNVETPPIEGLAAVQKSLAVTPKTSKPTEPPRPYKGKKRGRKPSRTRLQP